MITLSLYAAPCSLLTVHSDANMNTAIADDVIKIMVDLFNLPPGAITIDSSMETVEPWDSLQHINVVMDIEQHFGITLSTEEVVKLNSVRSIVEIIQAKLTCQES
jgi:acyl carrier protein